MTKYHSMPAGQEKESDRERNIAQADIKNM